MRCRGQVFTIQGILFVMLLAVIMVFAISVLSSSFHYSQIRSRSIALRNYVSSLITDYGFVQALVRRNVTAVEKYLYQLTELGLRYHLIAYLDDAEYLVVGSRIANTLDYVSVAIPYFDGDTVHKLVIVLVVGT